MIVKLSKEKKKYFPSLEENFKIKYLEEIKANPFYNCVVYIEDTEVKGYLSYNFLYDRYEIVNFETLEESRGQGIGRKMMIYFLSLAELDTVKNITLEVKINNPIIDFYKRIGFEERALRRGYYNGIDGILMEKEMIR